MVCYVYSSNNTFQTPEHFFYHVGSGGLQGNGVEGASLHVRHCKESIILPYAPPIVEPGCTGVWVFLGRDDDRYFCSGGGGHQNPAQVPKWMKISLPPIILWVYCVSVAVYCFILLAVSELNSYTNSIDEKLSLLCECFYYIQKCNILCQFYQIPFSSFWI